MGDAAVVRKHCPGEFPSFALEPSGDRCCFPFGSSAWMLEPASLGLD